MPGITAYHGATGLDSPIGLTGAAGNHFLVTDYSVNERFLAPGTNNPFTGGQSVGSTLTFNSGSTDKLAVTALVPNVFIHAGTGPNEAMQAFGGNNILDGTAGASQFMVGGTGHDQFILQAGTHTSSWDTLVNFHAGDSATVWGVSPQDFNIGSTNIAGAPGSQGLTFLTQDKATSASTNVTLAGLTGTALTSHAVSVSYGHDAQANLNYMQITAH